ncbi:MAG TPA: hypothetical protein VIH57_23865 [Bacteroidales bacterium]
MATNDQEHQLRIEIKEQLSKVTKANSPNIWAEIHKPDGTLNLSGYARIETKLIRRIVSGQLTPAAAIPQLEQEYDLM